MAIKLAKRDIGQLAVNQYLRRIRSRSSNLRPIWPFVLGRFYHWEQEVFAAEGAVQGYSRWADLSASYAAWKEAHYPGRPLMVLSGRTKAQMTGQSFREQPTVRYGPHQLRWQSNLPIETAPINPEPSSWDVPALHADPKEAGKNLLPERNVVRITDSNIAELSNIIVNYVAFGTKPSGTLTPVTP